VDDASDIPKSCYERFEALVVVLVHDDQLDIGIPLRD